MDSDSNGDSNGDNENNDIRTSGVSISDRTDQLHNLNTNNMVEIRDNLIVHRNNIVIFVIKDGKPCDDGSNLLVRDNKIPVIRDAILGRARVVKQNNRHIIALIKTETSALLEKVTFKETLRLLYDVILELNLHFPFPKRT